MDQRAYIIALQEQINRRSYYKALEIAEQAICSFPFIAYFFFSASQVHAHLGDQKKALATANQAVLTAPSMPEYRIHRALLFLAASNARSALADILIALEDQPQNLSAQALLRMCELISSL